MPNELHFEQLYKIDGYPTESAIGQSALKLYADTLHHPLVLLQNRHVFVATQDSEVRGVANIELRPSSEYAYLIGLAVEPAHRLQGVGSFMVKNLLHYAAEYDCTHLQVIPVLEAEDFYARLGFVRRSENSMYWIHNLQKRAEG